MADTNYVADVPASVQNQKKELLKQMALRGNDGLAAVQQAQKEADARRAEAGNWNRGGAIGTTEAHRAALDAERQQLLGGFDQARGQMGTAHSQELDRVAAANASYLDQLAAAAPIHQQRLDQQIQQLKLAQSAAASGGGGSRSGSKSKSSATADLNGNGIPDVLEGLSGQPNAYGVTPAENRSPLPTWQEAADNIDIAAQRMLSGGEPKEVVDDFIVSSANYPHLVNLASRFVVRAPGSGAGKKSALVKELKKFGADAATATKIANLFGYTEPASSKIKTVSKDGKTTKKYRATPTIADKARYGL